MRGRKFAKPIRNCYTEPDVEALLVNRVGAVREYFIVPIDECYKLVGLIRLHWRGLSGGASSGERSAAFSMNCDGRETNAWR